MGNECCDMVQILVGPMIGLLDLKNTEKSEQNFKLDN